MADRRVKIISTGSYVPKTVVPSTVIDQKLAKREGWTQRLFGIEKRHYATNEETTSYMAAMAARDAMGKVGIEAHQLDCIVAACGVGEQPIPSTAILVQNKLGLGSSGIAAFDINSTCLSFVTALDIVADAISLGKYKTVLIVSSDIASCGLDWSNPEAAAIFGDGAAAAIVTAGAARDGSNVIASRMESYGEYQDACRLEAGGTRVNPHREGDGFLQKTVFKMDGPAALSCVLSHLPEFVDKLCQRAAVGVSDIDCLILHQASSFSLNAVQKHLGFDPQKMIMIFKDYGNQIAASIPHALDQAVVSGKLNRGDKFILLGTSAGISIGGLIAEY
jgi:3-oxoacyl-[acyl-carrier-protein] synthase-3